MADFRAISVVCEAIVRQLRLSYKPALFNNQRLEFKVCLASDLISRGRTMRAGVIQHIKKCPVSTIKFY